MSGGLRELALFCTVYAALQACVCLTMGVDGWLDRRRKMRAFRRRRDG
jgi:hypothetical protein